MKQSFPWGLIGVAALLLAACAPSLAVDWVSTTLLVGSPLEPGNDWALVARLDPWSQETTGPLEPGNDLVLGARERLGPWSQGTTGPLEPGNDWTLEARERLNPWSQIGPLVPDWTLGAR